jgi:predicted dithiol-disulfide oxidoreductase (DUF899 family)
MSSVKEPEYWVRTSAAHFPNESDAYRRVREEILAAEVALKDQRERIAALRRTLPLGGAVPQDYVFREGSRDLGGQDPASERDVRLSELFAPGKDELIVIHFMFGADKETPCSMCTLWADGYNGVAPHVADKVNFVLVGKAEIGKLRAWARGRGWSNLRLLSSHDNSFNRDYLMETEEGGQRPGVSVFVRDPRGVIHHSYTTEMVFNPGHHRGIDPFSPAWHLFDLLPSGRGEWMPKYRYS